MYRTLQYTIENQDIPISIYDFLKHNKYSRHIITTLKKSESGILKNGRRAYTNEMLSNKDHLLITLFEKPENEEILPKYMNIKILYEDEDILIVDKDANTPIHPSLNNYENSLANGLAYYFREKGETHIFRCINRLDRDTSGLTIIAKNMLSGCILSDMVKNREIKRTYLALATGNINSQGTVNAPISRKPDSIMERIVDFTNGQEAITHYLPVKQLNGYTFVLVTLETGRTHQIRVHFKYINHPLPGDYLYNPDYQIIKRQALHSFQLKFIHPITKEIMSFQSPLPKDLSDIYKGNI